MNSIPGAVAWLIACPLPVCRGQEIDLGFQHIFSWEIFPASADSRTASCQLLVKEWALNTGKLHPGGLPGNTDHPDMTSSIYHGRKANDARKPVFDGHKPGCTATEDS